MKSKQTKFLKFIPSKKIVSWSVPYLLGVDFNFNPDFNLVKIGSFLKRNKTTVSVQDKEIYKRVTIKVRNGGVFLRDEVKGEKIGTKNQFRVKEGQFLMSKIDARNGAFGVVSSIVDNAIITGNFWTFDVDYDLVNPYFLSLLATTKTFLKFAEITSNGTTNRHYLQEELFLNTPIPLPSLEQQNQIVTAYYSNINMAKAQEEKAEELEKEIERYLLEALGVEPLRKIERQFQKLHFFHSKDMNRWGVEFNLYARLEANIFKSSKYKMVCIQDYFEINPTISFKELLEYDEISFIPMETVSDKKGIIKEQRVTNPQQGYTRFGEGNIIWARITPCMENGKSAIATDLKNGFGIGSTEFHVLKKTNEGLNISLLHKMLRSKLLTVNAKFYFTGSAGQQRVPKEFLENLYVPLPPLEIQESIVTHIESIKSEIAALRSDAAENRKKALAAFEEQIFQEG